MELIPRDRRETEKLSRHTPNDACQNFGFGIRAAVNKFIFNVTYGCYVSDSPYLD